MNLRDIVNLKRIDGDTVTEVEATICGRSHPIQKDLPHAAKSSWVYDVRINATGEIVTGISDAEMTLVKEFREVSARYVEPFRPPLHQLP